MSRLRIVRLLFVASAWLLGLSPWGCKEQGGEGSAPTATAEGLPSGGPRPRAVTAKPFASGPAPVADAPPQTFGSGAMSATVSEPGEEPREPLRYAPSGIARTPKIAVELVPPNGLTLMLALELDYRSADDGMSFAVTDAAVSAQKGPPVGPQQAMFDRMKGGFLRVRGEASTTGARQPRLTQRKGQTTTPPVPWLLHALMVPFPEEPIGVGATWKVEQAIDASGRKGAIERSYTLKAREQDRLTIAIDGADRWKAAGGRADGTTTLSGTVTVTTADPLPVEASLRLVETVEAKGKAPTGQTTLTVSIAP